MKTKYLASILLILLGTLLFKWWSGSFFKISEKANKEVTIFETNKRKKEFTFPSFSKSCVNINQLGQKMKSEYLYNGSPCNISIDSLTPNDSAAYLIVAEALVTVNFYKEKHLNSDTRLTTVYNLNNTTCIDSFVLEFKKTEYSYLLNDIINLPAYLSCNCP